MPSSVCPLLRLIFDGTHTSLLSVHASDLPGGLVGFLCSGVFVTALAAQASAFPLKSSVTSSTRSPGFPAAVSPLLSVFLSPFLVPTPVLVPLSPTDSERHEDTDPGRFCMVAWLSLLFPLPRKNPHAATLSTSRHVDPGDHGTRGCRWEQIRVAISQCCAWRKPS